MGSVDEQSTKSDEEYDDLAMQDVLENGYWSDDDEEPSDKVVPFTGVDSSSCRLNKYTKNLDSFLRGIDERPMEAPCSYSSLLEQRNERRFPGMSNDKMRRRSLSIPALGSRGSLMCDPILSGTPWG